MRGRRVQPDENGYPGKLEPGDYLRVAPLRRGDGSEFSAEEKTKWWTKPYWMCCTPNGHVGTLVNHEVEEHPDGTITVKPSILITMEYGDGRPTQQLWHGYLERGIWREC